MMALTLVSPGRFLKGRTTAVWLVLLLLCGFARSAASVPLAHAPGAPAGSYTLSEFEQLNLYNGRISFGLPLMPVGGRGRASTVIMLRAELHPWYTGFVPPDNEAGDPGWPYATNDELNGYKGTFGIGSLSPEMAITDDCPPNASTFTYMLVRYHFVTPDGTRYEFRSKQDNGRPYQIACSSTGVTVGSEFITGDGTGATFVTDTVVTYRPPPNHHVNLTKSGVVRLKDGTKYRIDNGAISSIQDPNGNRLTFSYDNSQLLPTHANPGTFASRLVNATDSLNRKINICHGGSAGCADKNYDQITFRGFGGDDRSIKINYASLNTVIRGDLVRPAKLFPEFTLAADPVYNPVKISSVDIPDGRSYKFFYNHYGELSRVELPTGAAYEYDHTPGSGIVQTDPFFNIIYRRLLKRRVYPNGGTGAAFALETVYQESYDYSTTIPTTVITEKNYAPPSQGGAAVSAIKHYYHGDARQSFNGWPTSYAPWIESREYKTEFVNPATEAPVKTVEYKWEQRAPVAWWSPPYCLSTQSCMPNGAPPNDPRVAEIKTTLNDVTPNLVTKTTFGFDDVRPFNNVSDIYEYDFGVGAPPAHPTRHTHTDYLTVNPANNIDYTSVGVHLRALPRLTKIYDVNPANGVERLIQQKEMSYDEFDLTNYPDDVSVNGIVGWVDPGTAARGNLTGGKAYENARLLTGAIAESTHYDILGNMVQTKDARNAVTEITYDDNFGGPDTDALTNTAPPELSGNKKTFAFAKKVKNAAGHVAYKQYDYYIGREVNSEDENGTVSSVSYDDLLERPKQVARAVNIPDLHSQTTFVYDAENLKITVTRDRDAFGDNLLKSETFYDGLGRTTESRNYETVAQYISTRYKYDPQGRRAETSTPHRPTLGESPAWTKTEYDTLGRPWKMTLPGGAQTFTIYHGARTLTTDPSDRQRIVEINAFGLVSEAWEVRPSSPATGTEQVSFTIPQDIPVPPVSAGYRTRYVYDALGQLRKVEQGAQRRYFAYDSLERLIRARIPEHDVRPAHALAAEMLTPLSDSNNEWTCRYEYDESGNLKKKVDARGVEASFEYDALNRISEMSYTPFTAQGATVNTPPVKYFYDTQTLPDGAPEFTLGKSVGKMIAVIYGGAGSATGTYAGEYDARGQAKYSAQVTMAPGAGAQPAPQTYVMRYEHNFNGNIKAQTYPSGKVTEMQYDQVGRLAGVKRQGGDYYAGGDPAVPDNEHVIKYAPHGAVSGLRLGNGLWEVSAYNTRLQMESLKLGTTSGASDRWRVDFGYGTATENNGNLRTQTITVPAIGNVSGFTGVQSYGYDHLNRIETARETRNTAAGAEDWKQAFKYDRYGNRTIDGDAQQPTTSNTTPSLIGDNPNVSASSNRLTPRAGEEFGYDPAGNLTSDSRAGTYKDFRFDAENRMILFAEGGRDSSGPTSRTEHQYTYDGNGRRVKKLLSGSQTVVYVYNLIGQLVAEYSNGPAPAGGLSYLTADNLGSTRVVTGQNKAVKSRHDYLPFGEDLGLGGRTAEQGYADDDQRIRFTGKERDAETKLDYFGARYYTSAYGRFLSPDDIANDTEPTDPASWNLYAYVRNNPLTNVDQTGKWMTHVHNRIIDQAFPGWSKHTREILMKASRWMDSKAAGAYDPNNFYRHALRKKGQTPEDAAKKMGEWIRLAKHESDNEKNWDERVRLFGLALHTVTDATSPSHEGIAIFPVPEHGAIMQMGAYIDWGLHGMGETTASYDLYRQGMAVGAADELAIYFFGADEAGRARGGNTHGSDNDPHLKIHRYAARKFYGMRQSEIDESEHVYRLGITEGRRRARALIEGRRY